MIKMKELKQLLDKKGIEYEVENQRVRILSCALGDNFYDYGKVEKPIVIDDEQLEFLLTDFRVRIITCRDCCGCAGW